MRSKAKCGLAWLSTYLTHDRLHWYRLFWLRLSMQSPDCLEYELSSSRQRTAIACLCLVCGILYYSEGLHIFTLHIILFIFIGTRDYIFIAILSLHKELFIIDQWLIGWSWMGELVTGHDQFSLVVTNWSPSRGDPKNLSLTWKIERVFTVYIIFQHVSVCVCVCAVCSHFFKQGE
jgi:hypothetical protein